MSPFQAIGSSVISLSEIDSTNNYAMELANGGMAEHGTVVSTDYQTGGKGQQGNHWQSEKEKNVLLSIILDTSRFEIQSQFLLNAAFCSAIAQLLMQEYELKETTIKWPNDIFVGRKKIAGILIENVIRGQQWQYAIVGIGININQEIFQSQVAATSLKNEKKVEISRLAFQKQLFEHLNKAFRNFTAKENLILPEYNSLLHKYQQNIEYQRSGETISGLLQGANQQGFLKIGHAEYRHGDIKILI